MTGIVAILLILVIAEGLIILIIGAVKGFTLSEVLWLLRDAWRDPRKYLRSRDEHGKLRPAKRKP